MVEGHCGRSLWKVTMEGHGGRSRWKGTVECYNQDTEKINCSQLFVYLISQL